MISAQATITAFSSISSIWSPKASPSTTAGSEGDQQVADEGERGGRAVEQPDDHVAEGAPV